MFADLKHLSHHAAWRRQLEMLLESAGEGIYGIDLRGRCIFINGAGAAMLGYTPDEVVGRNMHYLIHHSHADRSLMPVHDCRIFKAFRDGRGERVDDEVLWRRDGSCFDAQYASYPIRNDQEVVGAVVTFSDISARKRIERELQGTRAQLEARVQVRTAELSAAHESLRRLASHLSTLREQERAHIARNIHDDLGASFTALQLDLNWLRRQLAGEPPLQAHLDRMLEVTQTAMDATRRILNDLRPVVLDHLGLWAALETLLQDLQARSGLRCRYLCPPDTESRRLEPAAEIAVYRIVQELLTNVQRHARARSVSVSAVWGEDGLLLEVEDDGVGMRLPETRQTFGILGMRERARAIGGDLELDSAPGAGLCARLRLNPQAA
ncbi:PAS domain S-box protein [Achromobacter xylosoxidans]|uniref:sensor histidine kinase n=1 Tax=Achromobacter TaxID=222 RepID=UPI0001F42554|nr:MULTISPECIES: PAS domain-containing sensor histidine kinase [Achromobacter]AXA78752.1 PAS domain S-box protein [Achromobacter xylosoxidans]EFV85605.1 PAS/PAC sensor signal transduction histidine kinase [Achromobacter xylosoxidans C54]MCH1992735.1 PAS domain-containing sensor histidine kinase [Achromobacter xylosoxidans]MCZ8409102.1 PAS domain-containing sensor histidine kinase [Achromobacter dolens]NYS11477.1 PAS domain-containing sensor histidine kinase [Achromobacter xylosoxidans]